MRNAVFNSIAALTALSLLVALVYLLATSDSRPKLPSDVLEALHNAETFELISLEPENDFESLEKSKERFHDWYVLGRVEISDDATRARLTEAFLQTARLGEPEMSCWEPRHGVRLTQGGRTIDLVICFYCEWGQAYIGESRLPNFTISKLPQSLFDDELRKAKVRLARRG